MKIPSRKPQATSPGWFLLFHFSFFIFHFNFTCAISQQKNLNLNREHFLLIDGFLNKIDSLNSQTSFKPLHYNFIISKKYDTNVIVVTYPKSSFVKHPKLYKKLKEENLFMIHDSSDVFLLTLDPLFNLELGTDLEDATRETLYKNTRGVLVHGDIGKKFSFESYFLENQATYPQYVDEYIFSTDTAFPNTTYYPYHVIPGQGRSKVFKKNGYDFGYSSGYVSYSPNEHFNFQLGHSKHFVGDGYRSLLLSDNAFIYPFLRITSLFGKFQYTNLYAVFQNLTDGGVKIPAGTERIFQKKPASFQFLSWNVHKRIQLGFFQGLIWQASDSMNRVRLDFNYFNPLILVNPLVYGLHHPNNILLGSTLKLKITHSISLYGQYMIDDDGIFSSSRAANKQGFQVGAKYFDMFGIRNLHFQTEYNQVRPYSYAYAVPAQNYSHYNQPLAHPLGANFREGIAFLNYRIGDFFAEVKYIYADLGSNSSFENYGTNIFMSDTANLPYELNFYARNLSVTDAHFGYLINPSTNLNIVAGISNRTTHPAQTFKTSFIYFGIRTSLQNFYYDF